MSKMTANPVSRKSDLVTQEHEKEILIYDLTIDKAFSLNETSSLIWNLCNGKNSVSEMAASLSEKLNFPVGEDFVRLALEQLKKDNLLENGDEISIDFGGLSRRDVIRKVGFATLVVLPVVSALVAPTAIQASSVCPTAACRCPNASAVCPGSTVAGQYVNCNTSTGNNSCDCIGPFGAADSAGTGFKTGNCGLN